MRHNARYSSTRGGHGGEECRQQRAGEGQDAQTPATSVAVRARCSSRQTRRFFVLLRQQRRRC